MYQTTTCVIHADTTATAVFLPKSREYAVSLGPPTGGTLHLVGDLPHLLRVLQDAAEALLNLPVHDAGRVA